MSFAGWATAQPATEAGEICFGINEASKIIRTLKECDFDRRELDLLRQQVALKDQRIAQLEKENDLLKQEQSINQRILAVKDMEIEVHKKSFEQMKEVSDRALKLAETNKPQGNWMFYGLAALASIAFGALLAK
jgi:TolA-binding protein